MTDLPTGAVVRVAVRTLGASAARLAESSASEVIAGFERSVYLHDRAGHLACLGGDGLGCGPLNALAADPGFAAARWRVGDRIALDGTHAEIWRPTAFAAPPRANLSSCLAALNKATGHVVPRGFADDAAANPVSRRGRDGLAALHAWIGQPRDRLPPLAMALIGLGPGLTPAGDDALGGTMIALRRFGAPATADRLAADVLLRARAETSLISFAHLEAAAGGEGAAALHDTLAAIARTDLPDIVTGLRRLDRIGHSSGWDALAGAATALRALAG